MREILFRGKRTDTGEWVEGHYVCIAEIYHYIFTGKIDLTGGKVKEEKYLVDPKTVGQFTGLYYKTKWEDLTGKEKTDFYKSLHTEDGKTVKYSDVRSVAHLWKGKKLFEGDILRNRRKGEVRVVVFSESSFQAKKYLPIKSEYSYPMDGEEDFWLKEWDVVGNIHDNPEFLEKGNLPEVQKEVERHSFFDLGHAEVLEYYKNKNKEDT